MSATEINFDEFGAKAEAEKMADQCVHLKTTINKITEVVSNSKSGWEGDAANACGVAASDWEDEADRVKRIIERISEMVGEGNTKYATMEADNTDYFTSAAGNYSSAPSPGLTNLSV